jgi:hypothetical protein
MGTLLIRTSAGDEVLAQWSPSDDASVAAAEETYRHYLTKDYEAVQSDGTYYQPLTGDVLPVDAKQVILTTGLGGG